MTLVATKENIKTGEKIYEGLLGIDKEDSIYDPKIKYDSEILYNENTPCNDFTISLAIVK